MYLLKMHALLHIPVTNCPEKLVLWIVGNLRAYINTQIIRFFQILSH